MLVEHRQNDSLLALEPVHELADGLALVLHCMEFVVLRVFAHGYLLTSVYAETVPAPFLPPYSTPAPANSTCELFFLRGCLVLVQGLGLDLPHAPRAEGGADREAPAGPAGAFTCCEQLQVRAWK